MASNPMPSPDQAPDMSAAVAQSAQQPNPAVADVAQNAQQQAATATPATPQKPSLWKSIVAGALTGMANAGDARHFGAGLAAGAGGVVKQQQQQFQNNLETQRQNNANTAAQEESQRNKLQVATGYANLATIQRNFSLLPDDKQEKFLMDTAAETRQMRASGILSPVSDVMDHDKAVDQAHELFKSNPGVLYSVEPVRDDKGNLAYQVMQANDAPIQDDVQLTLPNGQTVTFPKGSVKASSVQAFRTQIESQKLSDLSAKSKATLQNANTNEKKLVPENKKADAALIAAEAKAKAAEGTGEWKPKVTSDEKKKAELAENIAVNAESVAQILQRRPDLVGAISGRFTNVQQMIGNNDPDISAIGTHIHNLAMANSGVHGFRSHEGVRDNEQQLFNNFKNGPRAVGGALQASVHSVQTFIDNARPETYKTHSKMGGVLKGISQ